MTISLELRRARIEDAAEIARLAGEWGYPTTPQEMARRLEMLLVDPRHHIAVAANGTALLGWIAVERRLTMGTGEQIEIVGLVVDTMAKRGGIGRALVADAERWAREQGFRAITVRSNVARSESHPFYEHLGYVRKKAQHVYAKALASG
jgi:GNAT superfamily N-acetyltransferase